MIDFYAVLSTVTRWVSASTGLMAFVLFLPGIFVEHSCSGLPDPSTTTTINKNEHEGKISQMLHNNQIRERKLPATQVLSSSRKRRKPCKENIIESTAVQKIIFAWETKANINIQ